VSAAAGAPAHQLAKRLATGAFLVWGLIGFARQTVSAVTAWRARASYSMPTSLWRFGSPQVDRFRRCASALAAAMPPTSRVAIAGADTDIFLWRWAAYELPAADVVQLGHPEAAPASFVLSLPPLAPAPRLEPLVARRHCHVYRVK
jgi:hypothetical protein